MPARVIPGLAVDVHVSPTGSFLVGCPECDWWPAVDKPLDDRSEAQRTAYNHNLEKHDGAGVEFVPDDILTSKQARIRFLRKQVRINRAIALVVGIFCVFVQWAAATSGGYSWINAGTLAIWFAMMWMYGFFGGRWQVRLDDAVQELIQVTAQHSEWKARLESPESDQ